MKNKNIALLFTALSLIVISIFIHFLPSPEQKYNSQKPETADSQTSIPAPVDEPNSETSDSTIPANRPSSTSPTPEPDVEYTHTSTDPETGLTLYHTTDNQPALFYNPETNQFNQYAPLPLQTFTRAESQCNLTAKGEIDLTGTPTTWAIPALGTAATTGYTQTNFELPATFDSAGRYGTWKSDTAHLSASEGAGIYAGHVNNPDGTLSAWGMLHQVKPCMSKYITDETGKQREYQATEVRLIKDPSIFDQPGGEYWRLTGSNQIYDITCAGPYGLGDDGQAQLGGSLWANYPYRVVVVWDAVNPA